MGETRFLAVRIRSTLADPRANPNVAVLTCSGELFAEGIRLYEQRPDKEWSLTDCISFVAMHRDGLTERSPAITISSKPAS